MPRPRRAWSTLSEPASLPTRPPRRGLRGGEEQVAGYSVRYLLSALGEEVPSGLPSAAEVLDKHYIPTWYPNGLVQGAPTEFYIPGGERCDVSLPADIFPYTVVDTSGGHLLATEALRRRKFLWVRKGDCFTPQNEKPFQQAPSKIRVSLRERDVS